MSYLRFFGLPIVAVMVGNALAALPPESELPRAPVPRAPVPRAPVQQRINLPPESELPSALAPSAAPPVTVSDRVKADGSSERKLPAESALPPLAGDPAPAPAGPLPLAGSPDGIPWLRLNLRGHTAPVRAAKFLSSGNRFCTAGDDKSVVVWLRDAAGAGRWHYERTIRWQIQRGTRGRIYALAAAPGILALAGEGAMGGTGEIVLVDPASGDYVSTLFDQANGHRQVVIALNFVETPDGPALASQSMDGRTLLWSKNKRGVWRAAVVMVDDRVAGTPVELSRQLLADRAFSAVVALDRQRVVVPVYDHRQQQRPVWRLEIFDLAAASQTPLGGPTGAPHRHGVTAMATDANRTRLISADGTGQIHVWDLKANPVSSVRLKRPQSAQALALSLSADGQTLALGTVASSLQQGATVEVWDLSNLRRPQLKTTRSSKGHVRACAVSADSIVSSDGNSVVVHNLADPWSKQVLRGATDTPLRVAFARDKPFYRIGIGTQTDDRGSVAIDRLFDTDRLQLTRTAAQNEQRWLPVDWGRGRWRVVESIDNRGRRQWMFEEGGARRARLPLVEERTGAFRSVCWIPGDDLERPPLAALGTSAGGIVVVQVTARGDAPIVRRFRGHGSEVTSMAVSRDLRWLVSGSTDTTVRVWPLGLLPLDPLPRDPLLRDLLPLDLLLRDPLLLDPLPLDPLLRGRVNQESGGLNRWGATFQTDDAGRFVVASIREDGPLYFRGARIGDEVVSIQKIENGQRRTVEAPEQLLSELAAAAWDRMVEFELRTGRQASHRFQILPAWQQLASLVTSGNGEWAFWAPSGYYDASFQGHQLFGWQINRGLEGLPDFFLAAQFRAILERPEVMSRLMRARTLEAAFRAAHATTPAHSAETIANMYRLKPEVTILPPFATELGRGRAGHRLQAQIRVPAGQTLVQPKAFANGVVAAPGQLLKSETDGGDELLLYQWQLAIPSDPRVLVQVIAATENEITASDQRVLENSVSQPDRMPRLFLLAVGIDRYRDAQIPKLRTPVAHVRRLTDLVRSHCSALYRVEATALLYQRATRPAWTLLTKQSAARLREQASPDDLLVIYLSGHGVQDAAGDQYHFVTADAEYAEIMAGGFADCLSFADFSQFSDISCRKLVILDTCHGGAIQPMRHREMKAAIRALQQDLFITLAASQGAEEAVEGRFSRRLIEALTGAADRDGGNRDGVVRLDELIAYVQRMVTVDSLHDSFHQTPSAGPSDLLPFVTPPMSIVAPQDQVGQIDRRRR